MADGNTPGTQLSGGSDGPGGNNGPDGASMTAAGDGPQEFKQALPWVLFISLLFLLNYSARTALSPLLVELENDFGVGHSQAATLLLMQGIGMSVTLGLGGMVLSRIQPRNMAAFSILAAGICFLGIPLCVTLNSARVAFFIFGMASGLYFAAGMTTLGSLVHYRDWGKAVGIHELAPNLSFIIFPLVAQGLLLFISWRGVLVFWGCLMIVIALCFFRYGRGGRVYADPPSLRGSLRLLKHRSIWIVMYLLFVGLAGEYAIFSILQLHLVSTYGLGGGEANYMLSLSRLVTPLMVISGGWAADRIPVRRFLCFCFTLHAAALMGMWLPSYHPAMIGVFVQAASIALMYPAIFKLLAECYPGGMQPIVLSLIMPVANLLGTGLTPLMLGMAGETIGFGPGFALVGVLSLMCVPAVLSIRRYEPEAR